MLISWSIYYSEDQYNTGKGVRGARSLFRRCALYVSRRCERASGAVPPPSSAPSAQRTLEDCGPRQDAHRGGGELLALHVVHIHRASGGAASGEETEAERSRRRNALHRRAQAAWRSVRASLPAAATTVRTRSRRDLCLECWRQRHEASLAGNPSLFLEPPPPGPAPASNSGRFT